MGTSSRREDSSAGDTRTSDSPDIESDRESVARSIVLRRLTTAPQTRAQLDAAMAKKNVPDEVRLRVLDRFTEVGLIDDAAFAQAWVQSRHTARGLSKRALGYELRKRGVEPGIADEAVETLAGEHEEEMARALVSRRLAATRRLDPVARTRRLAGMLARKGYPPGLSYRIVREALASDGLDSDALPAEHSDE